jgi:hypothetical protein
MSSSLSTLFERARIPFERASASLRPVNRDIFQLDIAREPVERVRLWTGDRDNEVAVLSIDESLGQVVLSVKEPRRPYEDRIRIREGRVTRTQIESFVRESGGGRVLHPRGSSWIIERFTEPAERRFLVGFDDRHLFAAQIPSGETVRDAHQALKPAEVLAVAERSPGAVVRQGEWFFVPATPQEILEVRRNMHANRFARWGNRLPGGGEPHWVEQFVTLRGAHDPVTGQRGTRFFVRGSVHHRDHRTVCFDRWRRVHLNAAVRRRSDLARGFYWVD